MLDKSRDGGDV